ncbi:MAG: hypothetical protein WCB77_26450, partial [Pseudolabrys sp.]
HNRVRMMIWIGGLLALATSLDSSLCGGLYTRGTMRMFPIWLPASDFTEPPPNQTKVWTLFLCGKPH